MESKYMLKVSSCRMILQSEPSESGPRFQVADAVVISHNVCYIQSMPVLGLRLEGWRWIAVVGEREPEHYPDAAAGAVCILESIKPIKPARAGRLVVGL